MNNLNKILVTVGIVVAVAAINAVIGMLLWNSLATNLFQMPTITFWQAFMIWALVAQIGGAFNQVNSSKS